MRLLGQFQTSLFFYEKISSERKVQKAQKRKQANKNKKSSIFMRIKTSMGKKAACLRFCAFCSLNVFS